MQAISRISRLFLLIAMICASPGVHAFVFSAARPVHLAGCHDHRPTTPSHTPVSYQCCLNGHHAAIPSAAFSARPLVARPSALDDGAPVAPASLPSHRLEAFATHANGPPGAAPLRI
jgi:hypothetical protein